jgi:tRNA threonylcarbamoyladenosine biosynthesis protein TsaE
MVKYKTLDQLKEIARQFSSTLKGGEVIGLDGRLGVGKTTFVQFVAKNLGIEELITSPTYNYLKVYRIPASQLSLVHVDAYRIKDALEIDSIGLSDYLKDEKSIIFIEWSQNLKKYLPKRTLYLSFDNNGQEYTIEGDI